MQQGIDLRIEIRPPPYVPAGLVKEHVRTVFISSGELIVNSRDVKINRQFCFVMIICVTVPMTLERIG
jgi:hypothetical protein